MTSSSKLAGQTVYYLLFASIGASLPWIPDPQASDAIIFGSIQLAGLTPAINPFVHIEIALRGLDLALN